jgi:hypothetical protein
MKAPPPALQFRAQSFLIKKKNVFLGDPKMVPEKAFFHEFHIEKGQVLQCLRRKTGTGTRRRYLPRKSMENQSLLQQLQESMSTGAGEMAGFRRRTERNGCCDGRKLAVKRMCEKGATPGGRDPSQR